MKIIEHGSTYQEMQCELCKAKIGFSAKDVEHKVMHDAYDGAIHETVTEFVYCPECGCRIVLSLIIDGASCEIRGAH